MRALAVALSLLAATVARADAPSPSPSPSPSAPSPLSIDRELAQAHHKKVAGAALIGVGSTLALVGQILLIHAAAAPESTDYQCFLPGCNHEYLNPAEVIPGAIFVAVGGAMLVGGIPVYTAGGSQARRASAHAGHH
jgi:hypothetical protein